jgi:hypothetical protein
MQLVGGGPKVLLELPTKPSNDLMKFVTANSGGAASPYIFTQGPTYSSFLPNDDNPRFYQCANTDCLLYSANRNPNNPQNIAEDKRSEQKVKAAVMILGAPLLLEAGATTGVVANAYIAYRTASAAYSLAAASVTGAAVSGGFYTGGAVAGAFLDPNSSSQDLYSRFSERFSYTGLGAAMTVGAVTGPYATAMFRWAGVPNVLSNATTWPGAVIRINSLAMGQGAGRAAQGKVKSSGDD